MSQNHLMPDEDAPLFVVCDADDVEPGEAKSFSLAKITESGEGRPFPIVVVRTAAGAYFAYVNVCPHQKIWLNVGSGNFFSPDRQRLRCGRHGAEFAIDSGRCVAGPCEGERLEQLTLAVAGHDLCLSGVDLVEAEVYPDPFDDLDDTMEIMIHPD